MRHSFPPRWAHRFQGTPPPGRDRNPPRWGHRYKGVRPRNRGTVAQSCLLEIISVKYGRKGGEMLEKEFADSLKATLEWDRKQFI